MNPLKPLLVATVVFSVSASALVTFGMLRYAPSFLQPPPSASERTEPDAGLSAPSSTVADIENSVRSVASKVGPSVVSIVVSKDVTVYRTDPYGFFYEPSGTVRRKVGGGTGFFIRKDGYVLTNKHVVSDPRATYAILLSNGEELDGKVLAFDPTTDLALVRAFYEDGRPYDRATPLPLVPKVGDVPVGSFVVAIGNALAEFQNTVTFGVVSGLERSIEASEAGGESEALSGLIQTDTAINPGNSGGPLVNLAGKVVGINTAVTQGANGIGFAIPLSEKIVDGILDSYAKHSAIKRSYLGIRYVPVTPDLVESKKLPVRSGVLVSGGPDAPAVVPDSPAARAGIRDGDVVFEADGRPITAGFGLKEALAEKFPGEKVSFKGYRKNLLGKYEIVPFTVELGYR